MRLARVLIFVVVALAQLAVPASAIWSREQTLRHGRVWKFKTAPVDPVDAIRGRYITLRFDAETIPGPEQPKSERSPVETPLYVVLKENAEGFAEVERVSKDFLKGDNVLKAQNWYRTDEANHVRFPFNRMWVTENNAAAAEKAYFENSRQGKQNAYVTVRVRNGEGVLEQLYIDAQPLPEYLRTHPQK
jgi:uncharacterized membrane-anchored protein